MAYTEEEIIAKKSRENPKKRKSKGNHGYSPRDPDYFSASRQQSDEVTSEKHPITGNIVQEDSVNNEPSQPSLGKKKQKKISKPESDNYPSITLSKEYRLHSQIKISDLQSLILYILADGISPKFVSVRHRPQIRKVVVLMIPGLELSMFNVSLVNEKGVTCSSPDLYYPKKLQADQLPDNLKLFADMFEYVWPVKTPGDDKYLKMHSPLHAMLTAPNPKSNEKQRETKKRKGGNLVNDLHEWKNNPVLVTELCHTADELLENDYILHPALIDSKDQREKLAEQRSLTKTSEGFGWVDTLVPKFRIEPKLKPGNYPENITADWEVLALDCEMCLTGESEFSLTRISVVEWDGSVVLDELVRPENPITNYLTQYSGITENMLKNVTTTLADIQKKLVQLLHPNTILVGHSLNCDLAALKMTHPYVIDTAILYPHPRGPPLRCSLKWLAQRYLNREIQKGHGTLGPGAGHDSIEDAKTCLDLVRLKCERGKEWGISDSQGENLFKRVARMGVRYKYHNICPTSIIQDGRSSAAVDWGNPNKGPGAAANFSIGCNSDEEVAEGIIRAVKGDDDGREIPGGGVDFTWGRLRELEALKGWWNNNRQSSNDLSPKKCQILDKTRNEIDRSMTSAEPSAKPAISLLPTSNSSEQIISQVTATLTQRIFKIYSALPPCTAFIIYSGSGNPIEMSRLQTMQSIFKREYKTKKWDQLSVKWTDVEEQALRNAHFKAKNGLGFVGVK